MDSAKHNADLKDLRQRNRNLGFLNLIQTLCLLLSLATIFKSIGTERTIVIPPSIMKSFWVTGDHASVPYLEQMAGFIAWLVLDVTPSSIDWKKSVLLGYVDPSEYGPLKTRQELETDRLKRLNASTYFEPKQLVTDERQQSVVIHGQLRTQINGQDTSAEPKAYLAKFQLSGGRIHLKSFQEIQHAK